MLKICRDGILRIHKGVYNRRTKEATHYSVPVLAWQEEQPHTFLSNIHGGFEIEEGLTMRELMLNLKPWQEVLGHLCCMDFPAFVAEAEKSPPVVTMDNVPKDMEEFTHILISGDMRIDARPKFKRLTKEQKEKAKRKGAFMLSGGREITNKYKGIETRWGFNGMVSDPEYPHGYSLDYTPIHDYAHLPITIDYNTYLMDMSEKSDFLDTDEPLLNPNNPLIKSNVKNQRDGSKYYRVYLDSDPSFYEVFIRGVFWEMGFHFSPMQREEKKEEIFESADELEKILNDGTEEEIEKVIQEECSVMVFDPDDLDDMPDVPEKSNKDEETLDDVEEYGQDDLYTLKIVALAEEVYGEQGVPRSIRNIDTDD